MKTAKKKAKNEFLLVSGAKAWTVKDKKKAKQLAEAEIAGVATEFRNEKPKAISVTVRTSETVCDSTQTPTLLHNKIKKFNAALSKCPLEECREVDGNAEYSMKCEVPPGLTDDKVEELAEGVATALAPTPTAGRLLSSERRLSSVTITEIGSTQAKQECPTNDAACAGQAGGSTTGAGNTQAGSGAPTAGKTTVSTGSNGSVRQHLASVLATCLLAFIVCPF